MEDRYNVECCEFMHAHDEICRREYKRRCQGKIPCMI